MSSPNDYARPVVMNTRQLCEFMGISYSNFKILMDKDESKLPPYFVIGTYRRWYMEVVVKWMKRNSRHWKEVSEDRDPSPAVSGGNARGCSEKRCLGDVLKPRKTQ